MKHRPAVVFNFQRPLACLLAVTALASAFTPKATAQSFTNVPIPGLPASGRGSVVWGDYDNDGRLDFLFTGNTATGDVTQLWRNTGSGFTNVPIAGLTVTIADSVAWGDYDNDGRLDFLTTGYNGFIGQLLWRNTGSGFTNVPVAGLSEFQNGEVAWGDYDNDGRLDFLITGLRSGLRLSQLWRNTGTGFTNVPIPGLPGVWDSSVVWGDYDNDGALDFLLTGTGTNGVSVSQLWRNTGGGFANVTGGEFPTNGLPGVHHGSAAWGDYDNDGRLDFLLLGDSAGGIVSQLWRNTGGGFTNVPIAGLPQVSNGKVVWGDYDNDGWLDFLISGLDYPNGVRYSQLWRNTGSGFTNVPIAGLPQVEGSSAAWGDYDNDGRLDFLLMGFTGSAESLQLWHNTTPVTNTPPTAPTGLTAGSAASVLTLSWNAASDAQTPTNGLSYNVRVGTTPGGVDLFAGHVNPTNGFRRVPAIGNAGPRLSLTLHGLPSNSLLYWGVQAVDTAFAGGPFATNVLIRPEITGVSPPTGPTVGGITITLQGINFGTNGTVTIGGSNAPVLAGSWTNTQIQCTLPVGQGTNVPVIVTSVGQESAPANFTYNLPGITNVNPSIGPTVGGTVITLRGTNFGTSGTVSIGGKLASVVTTNWSHTQIQCVLPAGQGLNQSVVVVAGGQPSPAANFNYAAPVITNVSPALVPTPGSNTMTLWGANFGLSGLLLVNGQFISVVATNWSDSEIKFLSPPGQGTNIPIAVITAGQSSPTTFYDYAPPGITNVSPPLGPEIGGITVTLQGTNFGTSGTVRVGTNNILATIGGWSHGQIQFTLPPGQGTNVPVVVSVSGQSSPSAGFNYVRPAITNVSPTTGPTAGGITITLQGQYFGTNGSVRVGGIIAPVAATNWSDTEIQCTLPAGQGTNVSVIVTSGGQASAPAHFSYAAPSITSVTPPLGPEIGGITITLTGTNFGTSGFVTMGTNVDPVITSGWSEDQIQFTLPAGQGTNVPIVVSSGGQASLPASFTYFRPAITNVSPPTGPTAGGVMITVKGQYFGTNGTVTFDGNIVFVASTNWSDNQIQFTLPAGQGTNLPVIVTSEGQASAPGSFSYHVPRITGMSPVTGPTAGGTTITLTGTNFGTSGAVNFDQFMVFVAATNWTDTQIRFPLPAGQGTNLPISVLTGNQTSIPTNFSYFVPGITNVSPPTGPTAGGATITLTGTNFGASGSVTFNGANASVAATNWSDSQIRFTLPQGQGTNLPIVVRTAGQSSSVAYFNYAAPVITSINPTSAPTAGDTELTLLGTNFGTSGYVKVGDKLAPIVFGQWSHNLIVCRTPVGSGESLPVVVITEGQASNPFYFSYLRPTLTITRLGSNVVLAWPLNAPEYWPEESTSLSGAPWHFISQGRSVNGGEYNAVLPVASTNMFFRPEYCHFESQIIRKGLALMPNHIQV